MEIARPWLLLGWDTYYPSGGLRNILAAFETEAEALACYAENTTNPFASDHPDYEFWRQEFCFFEVVNLVDYVERLPDSYRIERS